MKPKPAKTGGEQLRKCGKIELESSILWAGHASIYDNCLPISLFTYRGNIIHVSNIYIYIYMHYILCRFIR